MNIQYRDGLLLTSIKIEFRGASKVIENVVIDTGAAETIISPDVVEDIEIIAELSDDVNSFYGVGGSLHSFFSKKVGQVEIGKTVLKDIKIDFGVIDPRGNINGLLGLDLLMRLGAVIDFKSLTLTLDV